jgi:hypothetical protein
VTFSGREKRQFRALARLFAYRFLDTDIIQARGDVSSLFSQLAALLAALSFVVCAGVVYAYVGRKPPAAAGWAHEEFLISTTMAVIGVFTLLLWDALFPDRRDSTILGALPIRTRTVFCAKVAAIGTALSIAAVSVNSFTGVVFPLFILPAGQDAIGTARCFATYWMVMALASAFTFFTLLGIQGIAIHVLPHTRFQRSSGLIQCAAFFAVLTLYFLAPPLATPRAFADPGNALWYAVLPSYWFLGLFQILNGSSDALFVELARRAVAGGAAVTVFAGACFLLAYARQMRRAVEQNGIVPRRVGALRRLADRVARLVSPHPEEHAVLAFIGRTLARSRQHRSLIAIYAGLGLAYVFSGIAGVIYSPHAYKAVERSRAATGIPLLMLFFLIVGIRVSFSIPTEVRANWLFRMTDPFGSKAYLSAARKALLLFAVVPVVAISAAIYGAVWPWWKAIAHLGFIATVGLLLVELALRRWNKVPFACTYLPGKANLKVMFGVYWALLWFLSQIVILVENEALKTPAGYAVLMAITVAGWCWVAYRASAARADFGGLRFEEEPESVVVRLGIIAGD